MELSLFSTNADIAVNSDNAWSYFDKGWLEIYKPSISFSKFNISIQKITESNESKFELVGTVSGEYIDWDKHERRDEVKAVTFHLMDVIKDDIFKVRVILDL